MKSLVSLSLLVLLLAGCGSTRGLPMPGHGGSMTAEQRVSFARSELAAAQSALASQFEARRHEREQGLLDLLQWVSWASILGSIACGIGAIFLPGMRGTMLSGSMACIAALVMARLVGLILPWLSWLALGLGMVAVIAMVVRKYREAAYAAIMHGELADSIIKQSTDLGLVAKWQDTKDAVSMARNKASGIETHLAGMIKRVRAGSHEKV